MLKIISKLFKLYKRMSRLDANNLLVVLNKSNYKCRSCGKDFIYGQLTDSDLVLFHDFDQKCNMRHVPTKVVKKNEKKRSDKRT